MAGPEVQHDLRSVSKSVVGLVYGIALADDKVPPPEVKLYEQFPKYTDLAKQPGRDRLTIGHVLSMTLGFEWDELTIPYGTVGNSENAMEAAPDRFRFILERPIVGEPSPARRTINHHRPLPACTGDRECCAPACSREASCPNLNTCRPSFHSLQLGAPLVRSARPR